MAKDLGIGSPPSKSKPEKITVAKVSNTEKRESGGTVDLNFKVSAEFKREFKIWATSHDLTQKRALELAFEALKDNHL
ncbi:MAG: hypothetical protein ACJAS1_002398 [Oleiphilaceae bacterium]|jgi:hypothetical protein